MKSLFYVDAIKPPSATALRQRFATLAPTCRPTSRQDADDAGGDILIGLAVPDGLRHGLDIAVLIEQQAPFLHTVAAAGHWPPISWPISPLPPRNQYTSS